MSADTTPTAGYRVPEGMTPKALEDVAWALDHLSRLMGMALDTLIIGKAVNAGEATITFDLTSNDAPLSVDDAKVLREWVSGTDMQDDLRRWAADIDGREAARG